MKIGRCYFDESVVGYVYVPIRLKANSMFIMSRFYPGDPFNIGQVGRREMDKQMIPAPGFMFLDSKLIKLNL